jgi:hypothetical protein
MNPHRLAEERSLAFHRAVAARVLADPSLLVRARERVRGWLASGDVHPDYAAAWAEILDQPVTELVQLLVSGSESARALRQSTPFAGFLPPRERWAIWREVGRAQSGAEP